MSPSYGHPNTQETYPLTFIFLLIASFITSSYFLRLSSYELIWLTIVLLIFFLQNFSLAAVNTAISETPQLNAVLNPFKFGTNTG